MSSERKSRQPDKVLAHAERELAQFGGARPTDVLPLYKKFLRIEEHRLRLKHQAGGGGREICRRRSSLLDVLLRHVFTTADQFARQQEKAQATPFALLALGGFGRRELNPFSDVDVMFLHGGGAEDPSPYATRMIEQILYSCWDIGFKVGHSTRSIGEAIRLANEDMLTKTALLEARYLAGERDLARDFREAFRVECVQGREQEYIQLRMADQAARHVKFGNSVYMQEPHLKSGCGGLRDYQNLLWITSFPGGMLTTTQLVGKAWLAEPDRRRIDAAYDFVLRVRTDLHYASGRANDVLHLNIQEQLAQRLHYPNRGGAPLSELLMKDYYEHTRNIFRVTERVTEQFAAGHSVSGGRPAAAEGEVDQGEDLGGFFSRNGKLFLQDDSLLERDPAEIMRLFELAQLHRLQLSPALEDHLSRSPALVTNTFRYATAPREIFKRILSRKGEAAAILRMMHRVDFLGRYLPEFAPLTCLVQHEFFHRYTADEHTLVCVEKLDALASTEETRLMPYRWLFEKLPDPFVLYLALLLHDTGKAVGARPHSEASALFAQRAAMRLQLTPAQRRALILLVDHHITLSVMAQQRNLDDPETTVEFARLIRDQENLDALMLLTLADGQGTSAEMWSDWKESLVWQLYHATTQYFADRAVFFEQRKIERESLQNAVAEKLSDDFAEEIDAHFEFMPDNYFRAFSVPEITSHVELFREFLRNLYQREEAALEPAIKWEAAANGSHSTVSLCTWDWQQLLARIAGSLSVVPLNILSADIYTRGDGVVLDVFRVADLKGRAVSHEADFQLVERTLSRALAEPEFDFQPVARKSAPRSPSAAHRRGGISHCDRDR